MRESRILYFALGVLCVTSIGAVSLHDNGVEFADGSFQETASVLPATNAVQGRVSLFTSGLAPCATGTLYTPPAGKRLVVEWVGVQTLIWGGTASSHPVDVSMITWSGEEIQHPLVRIDDAESLGVSFHTGNRWSGPVTLYSEAGGSLKVRMCGEEDIQDDQLGEASFSGYLIDV